MRASQTEGVVDMSQVHVLRQEALPPGPTSQSVTRRVAEVGGLGAVGEVRNGPRTTTGWHTHGDHTACVYVVEGRVLLEWGPEGEQSVELGAGDFYVISPKTIHRESNPGPGENCWAGFLMGAGPEVINVDGPEPARVKESI